MMKLVIARSKVLLLLMAAIVVRSDACGRQEKLPTAGLCATRFLGLDLYWLDLAGIY